MFKSKKFILGIYVSFLVKLLLFNGQITLAQEINFSFNDQGFLEVIRNQESRELFRSKDHPELPEIKNAVYWLQKALKTKDIEGYDGCSKESVLPIIANLSENDYVHLSHFEPLIEEDKKFIPSTSHLKIHNNEQNKQSLLNGQLFIFQKGEWHLFRERYQENLPKSVISQLKSFFKKGPWKQTFPKQESEIMNFINRLPIEIRKIGKRKEVDDILKKISISEDYRLKAQKSYLSNHSPNIAFFHTIGGEEKLSSHIITWNVNHDTPIIGTDSKELQTQSALEKSVFIAQRINKTFEATINPIFLLQGVSKEMLLVFNHFFSVVDFHVISKGSLVIITKKQNFEIVTQELNSKNVLLIKLVHQQKKISLLVMNAKFSQSDERDELIGNIKEINDSPVIVGGDFGISWGEFKTPFTIPNLPSTVQAFGTYEGTTVDFFLGKSVKFEFEFKLIDPLLDILRSEEVIDIENEY